jgi:hypothetical protein
MGGTDDPCNLVRLTIEEHAKEHRKLYEKYGHKEDELAWLGLSKMIDKKEHLHQMSKFAGKKTVSMQVGIHNPNNIHMKKNGGKKAIQKMSKWTKNSRWMNNGKKDTRVSLDKVLDYEKNGWKLGRLFSPNKGRKNITKKLFWINKNNSNKRIPRDQVDHYIDLGWSLGMICQK